MATKKSRLILNTRLATAQDWHNDWEDTHGQPPLISVRRLAIVKFAVVVGLAVLLVRLAAVQLGQADQFAGAAQANRTRQDTIYAPRGNIYDRKGNVLASSTAHYQLTVTPFLLPSSPSSRQKQYQEIAALLNIPATEVARLSESKGLDHASPIVVSDRLDQAGMLRFETQQAGLPGFALAVVPVREYVADAGLSHVLGYVSQVSPEDLDQREDILSTDFIGRTGIEAIYDKQLRGKNGFALTEVNALGQVIRLLSNKQPSKGGDITLTIDLDLQRNLLQNLQTAVDQTTTKRASAVVLDPRTGEILAMVSLPGYDNNLFAQGISSEQLRALINDPDQPLVNKATSSSYPAGSTIKPLVASAALQEGIIDDQKTINDKGFISIPNRYDSNINYLFRSWRPGGLGPVNIRRALAMSSNIFFYTVGGGHDGQTGLGVEKLARYYRLFGLGSKTGIDLPAEVAGRVPDHIWKQSAIGESWYLGDTYNLSIGQGYLKVTPLQMAMAHAAIANNGRLVRPHLASGTADQKQLPISVENLQIVREGMHEMIYKGLFCACRFSSIPVEIAGKTGTAETDKLDPKAQPHGWFLAFGPWENPEILVAIMIEQGQKSSYALEPAIHTLEYYFSR